MKEHFKKEWIALSGIKHFFYIIYKAGVIDPDYRGNVRVLMFNFGAEDFKGKQYIITFLQIFFLPIYNFDHESLYHDKLSLFLSETKKNPILR